MQFLEKGLIQAEGKSR